MNKQQKSAVTWVKPAEPSFLTKFKSDVGFKEGPTVDTKRQIEPTLDDDSGSDREDEAPQIVVLKTGDLTEDEVKKIKGETRGGGGAEKDDEPPADGKILFKKPAKRSSDKFQGITASSSKKKRSEGGEKKEEKEKEVNTAKKVKNNSLLSFGGDEDDDDED